MIIQDFAWLLLIALFTNSAVCDDDYDEVPRFQMINYKFYLHYYYDNGQLLSKPWNSSCEIKLEWIISFMTVGLSKEMVRQNKLESSERENYQLGKNALRLVHTFIDTLEGAVDSSADRIIVSFASYFTDSRRSLVDYIKGTFSISDIPTIQEHVVIFKDKPSDPTNLDNEIRIGMSYKLFCEKHLYGRKCLKYCKPANSVNRGHYYCDSEGNKHCLVGWLDVNSNCTQQASDTCDGTPCLNGGTCTKMLGQSNIWCECPSGYAGYLCEKCQDDDYCKNGGTCVPHDGKSTCDCPIHYKGPQCQVHVKHPCAAHANPCLNGATCHEITDSSYLCECPNGFTGNNCGHPGEKKNYCLEKARDGAENPCANNGACSSQSDTFKCKCPPGVNGNYCEFDIDECKNTPCQHNERCINTIGSYACLVESKKADDNKGKINCIGVDCLNGGTCHDRGDTYSCECTKGFSGTNCNNTVKGDIKEVIEKIFQGASSISSVLKVSTSVLLIGIVAAGSILRSI